MQSNKSSKTEKIIVGTIVVLILVGAGYWLYNSILLVGLLPEMGIAYPVEGRDHVSDGTVVDYKTNPPTSGSHYAEPADWGVYGEAIPDERLVHNLEHGGIWISYRPSISDAAKDRLTALAKSYKSKVIMVPREKNDTDIALVSWGRIYKMGIASDGSFDEKAIKNYIKKYKDTGPEILPDM